MKEHELKFGVDAWCCTCGKWQPSSKFDKGEVVLLFLAHVLQGVSASREERGRNG